MDEPYNPQSTDQTHPARPDFSALEAAFAQYKSDKLLARDPASAEPYPGNIPNLTNTTIQRT